MVEALKTTLRRVVTGHGSGSELDHSSSFRRLSISHVVSSLNIGGMEQVVLRLAIAQKEQGHDVAVLALNGGSLESVLQTAGVPTRVLSAGRASRGANAIRHFLSAGPDVVHAHNPTSLHYAVLSKIVSRAIVVVTVHGDQETHARTGSSLEWSMVASVVVVSNAAKSSLAIPCDQRKLTVIHNGISPVSIQPENREQTRQQFGVSDSFVGAFVARIDGRKGHITLLKSLERLKKAGVDATILVVGDGRERPAMESLSREMSLGPESVRFLGSRSDVGRILEAADFFVLPSDTEGLPLSVLEAMSFGLPIVASRVGGLPELIQDQEQGILIAPGDAVALAEAIRSLYESPSLRQKLGSAALARSINEFSLAGTVQNYERLYRVLLGV